MKAPLRLCWSFSHSSYAHAHRNKNKTKRQNYGELIHQSTSCSTNSYLLQIMSLSQLFGPHTHDEAQSQDHRWSMTNTPTTSTTKTTNANTTPPQSTLAPPHQHYQYQHHHPQRPPPPLEGAKKYTPGGYPNTNHTPYTLTPTRPPLPIPHPHRCRRVQRKV